MVPIFYCQFWGGACASFVLLNASTNFALFGLDWFVFSKASIFYKGFWFLLVRRGDIMEIKTMQFIWFGLYCISWKYVYKQPVRRSSSIRMAPVWRQFGTCRSLIRHLFGICLAQAWHLSGTGITSIQHWSSTSLAYIWHLSGIHLAFVRHRSGTHLASFWH